MTLRLHTRWPVDEHMRLVTGARVSLGRLATWVAILRAAFSGSIRRHRDKIRQIRYSTNPACVKLPALEVNEPGFCRMAVVLCPANSRIPINPILCNSHQRGNKTKWCVINCTHRIIESVPNRSEFPFWLGVSENGVRHFQFSTSWWVEDFPQTSFWPPTFQALFLSIIYILCCEAGGGQGAIGYWDRLDYSWWSQQGLPSMCSLCSRCWHSSHWGTGPVLPPSMWVGLWGQQKWRYVTSKVITILESDTASTWPSWFPWPRNSVAMLWGSPDYAERPRPAAVSVNGQGQPPDRRARNLRVESSPRFQATPAEPRWSSDRLSHWALPPAGLWAKQMIAVVLGHWVLGWLAVLQ